MSSKKDYSTIFLLLCCIVVTLICIKSYVTEAKQNTTIPTCYICDYYGCEYSTSSQAGGTQCSSFAGICESYGDCCGDCSNNDEEAPQEF